MRKNKPRIRRKAFLFLIILVLVWFYFPKRYNVLPIDDSYIHLTYVRNLVETGSFCFNPGEPSLGTSSPLWVVLLAAFSLTGIDPYWAAQILSLIFFAGLCLLAADMVANIAARLGLSEKETRCYFLLTGLLLALNGNLHWFASSGMETMLFLGLCFLAIRFYSLWGFSCLTGAVSGLIVLTRAPGILLGLILICCDFAKKRFSIVYKGLIAMALVVSPYIWLNLRLTGSWFPTTARGKLLTYVSGGLNAAQILRFLKNFTIYQQYLPQNIIFLGGIGWLMIFALRKYKNKCPELREAILGKYQELSILIIWGLGHLTVYTVKFRSLFHHTRYLANEYIILTVLGITGFMVIQKARPRINWGLILSLTSLMLTAGSLPYWQKLYINNLNQVEKAYISMGKWIGQNTAAEARIAAFDIGVLRYIGNRYTIDLGGLVDPAVHPYLKTHECGEYVRRKKADYIMYSRYPDTEAITGIFLAEYQGPMLLKQLNVAHFEAPQYPAPTLTQSYRTDLNKVSGWFTPDREGKLQLFAYDGRAFEKVGKMVDDQLEFVCYSIDNRTIEYISPFPFIINFSYFFKAKATLNHIYWVHLAFFDAKRQNILLSSRHIPTHNLITYFNWPVNRIIQEHHVHFLSPEIKPQKYLLRVAFTQEEDFDEHNPEKYKWFDLGIISIKKSPLAPLNIPDPENEK